MRFCRACFTGRYPVEVTDRQGKLALEPGVASNSTARI
jgi:glutamine phosphoribosylpyrophosphate amidotransferase